VIVRGQPLSVMGFTIVRSKIVEIDVLADGERLQRLELPVLDRRPFTSSDTRS
jgi:hypothetical protein